MEKTVFVVDDNNVSLTKAKQILEGHYRVFTLPSAQKMFTLLEKIRPDLILLDIEMPEMKGDEAIAGLRKDPAFAGIPVLFMTGWSDDLVMAHCLELGAADFVHKPFPDSVLLNRVGKIISIKENELHTAGHIMSVMSRAVEARCNTAAGHGDRVAEYIRLMMPALKNRGVYAEELRGWDAEEVPAAAMFHDIGMITVPESILNKPAAYTKGEYTILWNHPAEGERIINEMSRKTGCSEFFRHAGLFAGYHHENWDGSGYPHGLGGVKIPLEGRILAVADMYDKMVKGRVGQSAVDHKQAIEFVQRDSGTRFDPEITAVFLEIQNGLVKITES